MKKAAAMPLFVDSEDDLEIARIVPIRTETTLTRYPFHRIAKKEDVRIKQTRRNERGRVETTWEVRNPPGPLAYKLDTIVVNRRIDEMRNRGEIRQLIKLGSLRDICEELGINASGKNTNAIKEALRQNAFAGITAKLEFAGTDGAEKTFEFNTTRYTVIFTGEKLPNGEKADAVYIELHPRYHEMLRHAKTRPLDYKYLKGLPPSAQRLYELLSFSMFGTLKHGRPNTQMLYSEFCQSAPLTRYQDWDKVRPQMYKIHKPHIEAGYIKSVEFEKTVDAAGATDWLIKYTPGRKARHEFKQFTTKEIEVAPNKPRLLPTGKRKSALSTAQQELLDGLLAQGVTEEKGLELVQAHPERVQRELEAFPHRNLATMKDPAAWLIRAIEKGNYTQPAPVEKKRRQSAAQKAEARRAEIEQQFRGEYAESYLVPLRDSLAVLHPVAAQVYAQHCAEMDRTFTDRPAEELAAWKLADLGMLIEKHAEWGLLTFEQWMQVKHPEMTIA